MDALSKQELFKTLANKASLKLDIYNNTLQTLRLFKAVIEQLTTDFHAEIPNIKTNHPITFENEYRGDFEIKMKFGGDILIFLMHTNVFEFSRDHDVMRTSYIREDRSRSFSGVINIYNFLADSFRYKRVNDIGYLIGRVFINKDNHYFIEGKRELGFLYNDFGKNVMNADTAGQIIEAAILYTINFDLLSPPYDAVKMVTLNDMIHTLDEISIRTGKRLGFQFQQDRAEG